MNRKILSLTLLTSCICASLLAEETGADALLVEPPIDQADRDYWAYQPVIRPQLPDVKNESWCINSIDRFILAKLEKKHLSPVSEASPEVLLRRVTFDLTGLPPTLEELNQHLANNWNEAAYQQLLDSLLNRQSYGERWAQHWLDLVRFAETDGFEHDKTRPQAWRYRDWVIRALNADLPYDDFIRLQIAGDEFAPKSEDALLATGYLLAGPDMPDINSQDERRHNFLNGMTANVGEVFLGLRFGCAQCHHHRTDPISQHDFYRLRSFFETIDLFKDHSLEPGKENAITARIARNRSKQVPGSYLWIRGDYRRPGPELSPGFPRVLAQEKTVSIESNHRRTSLANWLTDRQHPLTARVIVNRVWQQHFGIGLVSTASDFGWMGEPATHSELLDWLAAEFMESGWSLKSLHKLILSSATYRLASYPDSKMASSDREHWNRLMKNDPSNQFLGRMNRRRLEGEAIRDAMLSASGELNPKFGGPGVRPPLPAAVASTLLKNQWPITKDESEHTRRSIYLFARRNLRMPLLEAFDKPDTNLSCPRRSQTTIAPQALHLLNSEFARDQAKAFSERIAVTSDDESERVAIAYQLALGRRPSENEVSESIKFIEANRNRENSWIDFCHALLNLNEFIYID